LKDSSKRIRRVICVPKTAKQRKDQWTMYKASEVVAIGEARDLIRGQKPFQMSTMDSEGSTNRLERDMDDIDESDE
jgi:hypothetical protein